MRVVRSLKIASAALALSFAAVSNAALLSFSNEFSGSGASCANTTCATLSLVQNGSNVDFVLTASLTGGEFITSLYGNWDPFEFATSHFSFSNDGGTAAGAVSSLSAGADAFKADGDGFFDWVFAFNTSGDRFTGTEVYTWTFTNATLADILDAISVNGPAGKNGFTFAMHVQGLGANANDSGWINSGPDQTQLVPEPGTLALLGLGLAGMGLMRRRRS